MAEPPASVSVGCSLPVPWLLPRPLRKIAASSLQNSLILAVEMGLSPNGFLNGTKPLDLFPGHSEMTTWQPEALNLALYDPPVYGLLCDTKLPCGLGDRYTIFVNG